MTTNAIDLKKLMVASDSRWSFLDGNKLYFVDDTHFEKIGMNADAVLICAGDGVLIDQWQQWLHLPNPYTSQLPPVERLDPNTGLQSVHLTILGRPDGAILFIKGSYHTVDTEALFAGSGKEHAHRCFYENRDVARCIATAAQHDYFTGGLTKMVKVATGEHNLHLPVERYQHVVNEFQARGMVMDIDTKRVTSIHAAANQSNNALNAGIPNVNLSAPSGEPMRPWTGDDKQRLSEAVAKLAERSKARREDQ